MKPIVVMWNDAYSIHDEWTSIDNYQPKPNRPNITVGYIVAHCDKYLHMAATIDQDGPNFCTAIAIPLANIVFVSSLNVVGSKTLYGDSKIWLDESQHSFLSRPQPFQLSEILDENYSGPLTGHQPTVG